MSVDSHDKEQDFIANEKVEDSLETLLLEFNEQLQSGDTDAEAILRRCPESQRKELRSLINTLILAEGALKRQSARRPGSPRSAARPQSGKKTVEV